MGLEFLFNTLKARRQARRIARLNARTKRWRDADVLELRKLAFERSKTINELRKENAELVRANALNVEAYNDKIDRLERRIAINVEENRLLAAIHDRDVERMVTEIALMRAKAEQVAERAFRPGDVFGEAG